jgi:hypothetical protein
MCLILLLLQQMVFFVEILLFLQLSWIRLFGRKWAYHHLEISDLKKDFFQKLTQFSQGNNVLDSTALTHMLFFQEIHVFHKLCWVGLFGTEPISTLKNPSCRKFSFQKQTQFSQGNNVLDVAASNTDGFPLRDSCVSSTQLNRPICRKQSLSPPWNTQVAGSIPLKTNSILSGKQCATLCSF